MQRRGEGRAGEGRAGEGREGQGSQGNYIIELSSIEAIILAIL
jgi:hypothetical protein